MQQPAAAGVAPQSAPPPVQYTAQHQPWMSSQPPHPQMWQQPPPSGAPPQHYGVSATPVSNSDEVRTLWIGDLQYWMDENYLYNCFAPAGEVVSVKVIRNKQTSLSEGYGFIEFANRAAAERTLSSYNGALMPQTEQAFRLNWATLGAGQRRQDDSEDFTIFVGDIAADITDSLLQDAFKALYPSVKGAKVITDHITGRSKGYGFVHFGDETEQKRAMTEMNGAILSTRPMRIGPAANKKSTNVPQKGHQEALVSGAWN